MNSLKDVVIANINRVLDTVSEKTNAANVVADARNQGITTHVAARELAQERALTAMKLRGRVA